MTLHGVLLVRCISPVHMWGCDMSNLFDYGMTLEDPCVWDIGYLEDEELDFTDFVYSIWYDDWEYQLWGYHFDSWDESKPWCETSQRRVVMWDEYVLHLTSEVRCACHEFTLSRSCDYGTIDLGDC